MITTARPRTQAARPQINATSLLWSARILLAVVFVVAALPKLAGAHSTVSMFRQIGGGQGLRYLTGTAELAGAIGLLAPWPRLAGSE